MRKRWQGRRIRLEHDFEDEIDIIEQFENKVKPKEVVAPLWTTIEPFTCYLCKKLNTFTYNYTGTEIPYKVPIYETCSLPCRYCHTSNICIDPYDYRVLKESKRLENLSSLIY